MSPGSYSVSTDMIILTNNKNKNQIFQSKYKSCHCYLTIVPLADWNIVEECVQFDDY
jgi:hypothetical protein